MATTIQNLHSLTAGNQPGDLMPGEIAYNLADGYVYLGNGSNAFTDTLGQQVGTPSADGLGWQQAIFNAAPINGSVTLAGIYDAQDNLVTSVTAAGTAVGFTAGAALPAAVAGNEGYYVLVQIGGTLTPPAPTGEAQPGDWLVSSGTGWALVQESSGVVPASQVTIVPTGDFTGPTMQDVLTQIQLLYVSMADGTMSQLNCNGDAIVYGNTALGDTDTDSLTVNATSTFAAPITAQGITCGAVVATNLYSSGNLMAVGDATIQGNVTLNADATTSVTVNGPISAANNLTVAGVTQLNGATQINGSLTTTSNVALTGTAGVTLSTPLNTTGSITITVGQTTGLTINSSDCMFTSGSKTTVNGDLYLNQGVTGKVLNYARSTTVQAPMNQFLVVPGTIIPFGGATAPAGYVPCDGSTLSTTGQYADLFAAIGYSWGGSGSSFKVPDLRGLFLRGVGANGTVKDSSGRFAQGGGFGTYQKDAFAEHFHNFISTNGTSSKNLTNFKWGLYDSQGQGQGTSLGGLTSGGYVYFAQSPRTDYANLDQPETVPVNATILYCIKY